jgi:hypothetical protein
VPRCWRRFNILPANIYPNLKFRMLEVLDCADNPKALGRAIARHTADELEAFGEEQGLVFAKVRSAEEFVATDLFDYLAERPLIEIERIGDSAPEPLPAWGTHPHVRPELRRDGAALRRRAHAD